MNYADSINSLPVRNLGMRKCASAHLFLSRFVFSHKLGTFRVDAVVTVGIKLQAELKEGPLITESRFLSSLLLTSVFVNAVDVRTQKTKDKLIVFVKKLHGPITENEMIFYCFCFMLP